MCFNKFKLRKIIVNVEHKRRFIEVLLLISSIMVSLRGVQEIPFTFLFFMLFLIVSLMYYATLFVKPKNGKRFWLVPFIIALFFSAFTSLYLIASLGESVTKNLSIVILIYYIGLIFVIFRILMAKEE